MTRPGNRGSIVAFASLCFLEAFACGNAGAQMQETPAANTWTVTIVLPPKIVAGELATLATLGADGKLAPHVTVDFGNGDHIESDTTGRAVFAVPKTGAYLIARAGASAIAAAIDSPGNVAGASAENPSENRNAPGISVSPVLPLNDRFWICGGGFEGAAEKNRVQINDQFALVIASSPECIVVAAAPNTPPGAATILLKTAAGLKRANTAFVSFDFLPPNPPLITGAKSRLTLRAAGSEKRLRAVVENETPAVLRFEKGDSQEVTTGGGAQNTAQIRVEAVSSGDFSFHAQLRSTPNVEMARQFLELAEPLAPLETQPSLRKLAASLAHHPRKTEKMRIQLQQILSRTPPSELHTLLASAYSFL